MRTLLWVFAWIAVGIWTLFTMVGYGLLGYVGDAARAVTGAVPGFTDETFSLAWLVNLTQNFGGTALVVVWAVGAGLILLVPIVAGMLLPRGPGRALSSRFDMRSLRIPGFGRSWGPGSLPFDRSHGSRGWNGRQRGHGRH